jgi:hypothetical protein
LGFAAGSTDRCARNFMPAICIDANGIFWL